MRPVLIIPARKGSIRLPGKNLLPIKGLPLIEHSINYALKNQDLLERIIITTDDPQVKELAKAKGCEVVDRPTEFSTSFSPVTEALKHTLEVLNINGKKIILLQATNPLRPESLLKEAIKKLGDSDSDSLMTVTRSFHKLGKIEKGFFSPLNYELSQRSQDLEPLYYENGLLYITNSQFILRDQLMGDKIFPFVVDHPGADLDIDDISDFEYAQFLLEKENL